MKVIVFDTETTGLIKNRKLPLDKQPEIIEINAVLVDLKDGKTIDEYDALINPSLVKDELPPIITKITGLKMEDLSGKPKFMTVHHEIQEFFNNCDACIAHNLSYDRDMIDIEFERMGVKFKWPERMICTIEQTMHLTGYRLNLQKLHTRLFSEGFEDAHRARNDVAALVRVACELHKKDII